MRRDFLRVSTAAALAGLLVAACNQGGDIHSMPAAQSQTGAESEPSFSQFPDIPIPAEAEMDVERTLVLGSGDRWLGRLVLKTADSPNALFNFFKRKMPEMNWQEITSVRSAISVLTFSQSERVATVQIQGRTLRGAEAFITVSPRDHGPAQTGARGGSAMPPPVQQVR